MGTTVIINEGRKGYAWVTLAPLVFVTITTLAAGFLSAGMDVTLLGPLPTPAIAMVTRSLRADLGVMISASHNPYEDNGIKIFGGDGFKKVFNCPLRRRPVSESVDAEDLVVSNAATALANCGRITHKIKMRRSVLKRMQIIGAYRGHDPAVERLSDVAKQAVAVLADGPRVG